jgi:tetratricopeptide (TPR) repeat protein
MHKRRLDSWKAIAEFLGRSLRTVQRWHDLNGLPVHHFGGHKGSVFAYEEEIDSWLAGLAETSAGAHGQLGGQLETARRTSRELTTTAENMWETRSVQSIEHITELYHKAIDNDPNNSAAYIGLANATIFSAMNDVMDAAIALPIAMDALRRIPTMDSDSIDAKCPAAWLDLLYSRNWQQARSRFEEVVSKHPSSSFARSGLAMSRTADGRIDEAVELAWEAWRLNPLARSLGGLLCWFVYLSGDFQSVLALTSQMRCGGGNGPFICTVEALVLAQDLNLSANLTRLESTARDQPQNQLLQGILGYAYGIAGEESKARAKQAQLSHWAESARKNKGYPLALVSLGLHKDQEAISWLEASYAESSLWSLGFRLDPILRRLKGRLRFERLLGKIGTPSPYQPAVRARDTEAGVLEGRELVEERP